HAFFDGHIEYVGDGLAAQSDFQGFGTEAGSLASTAGYFDIRHEIELRGDYSFTLAFLTAPSFYVETEAAGFVFAFDSEGRLREQFAYRVIETNVGGRIGTAVATDRRLINVDDLMDVFKAVNTVVGSWKRSSIFEALPKRFVENLIDESALAGTGSSCDRDQHAEGDSNVNALQIVFARSANN